MECHKKGIRGNNDDIEIYWPDILDQNILYSSAVYTQKLMERIKNSIITILWTTVLCPFTLKVSTIRIFLMYASVFLWSRQELPSRKLCYLEFGCWDTLSNSFYNCLHRLILIMKDNCKEYGTEDNIRAMPSQQWHTETEVTLRIK